MMGRRIWRRARQLRQDERGATIVEFALVAPVLLLSIMGICDIGYNIYTQALLRGAIQKAARDSTIEGAGLNMDLIDVRVTRAVRNIVPSSDLSPNPRITTISTATGNATMANPSKTPMRTGHGIAIAGQRALAVRGTSCSIMSRSNMPEPFRSRG
jgi:Flp pilus assembly protein TadG